MKQSLRKLTIPIIADILLYIILFIAMPMLDKLIGKQIHVIIAFFLPIIIITSIGMFLFLDRLKFWLFALIPYLFLMFLYIPPSAYGLDSGPHHPSYRQIGILVSFICFTLTQLFVWVFVKLFRLLQKLMHKPH